jgi:ketosteroid isomerase-like protein
MKTRFILAGCLTLLSFLIVFSSSAADANIEQAIRDLDAQWSKAAQSKDVNKTVSFYSDDAIVLPPNEAMKTTKEAIRKIWKDLLESPGLVISWTTTKVKVAKSGEMAYSSGTYELSMSDASGNLVKDRGKYLAVWEKQPDGNWKCGADMWNSDLPAGPAEKK